LAHRLLFWLVLSLCTGLGLIGSNGVVLCVESDGCVSVEVAGCADCHAPGNGPASDQMEGCPCRDVPYPGTTVVLRRATIELDPTLSTLVAGIARDVRSGAAPHASPERSTPPGSDALERIRTVVLLV
jgi:hypothetical protein